MKTKRRKDNSRRERPKNGALLRSGRKLKRNVESRRSVRKNMTSTT